MTQVVTFRSLTIGDCDEDYVLALPGVSGLGIPDVKILSEIPRYGDHGFVSGPDYLGQRTIGIPVSIHRKDDPSAAMIDFRALKTAWQPTTYDEILSITIAGYGPSDDTVRFYGRPRNAIDVDLSRHYTGTINALATFVALDPVGYGPEETDPLSTGSNTVTNPGDAPTARAILSLTGNGGTPVITNQSLGGRAILFQDPIPSSETWTIDLLRQTVRDASGDDQFSTISPASTWFHLGAGDNTLVLSGVASGSITFRGGWW